MVKVTLAGSAIRIDRTAFATFKLQSKQTRVLPSREAAVLGRLPNRTLSSVGREFKFGDERCHTDLNGQMRTGDWLVQRTAVSDCARCGNVAKSSQIIGRSHFRLYRRCDDANVLFCHLVVNK